jgi:hypothetical protein
MLWHVSDAMEVALGTRPAAVQKKPAAAAHHEVCCPEPAVAERCADDADVPAGRRYEFTAERDRCLKLIDELSAIRLEDEWPDNPVFGRVHGRDVSRLHAKHLNHHLTQFGV